MIVQETDELTLVASYAAGHTPAVDPELTRFLALPEHKRVEVVRRLKVIDAYQRISKPRAADAEAAAEALGLRRSSFYRMLEKLRKFGPVTGLAPDVRAKQRPSSASAGLGEVAEGAIAAVLQVNPEAPLKEVLLAVQGACNLAGAPKPADAAIRLRVNALRALPRSGSSGFLSTGGFGRSLLVDQTATALIVSSPAGPQHAVLTFIVDKDTRAICGVGVAQHSGPEAGLREALSDMSFRLPSLPIPHSLIWEGAKEIHWVLPAGIEQAVWQWSDVAADLRLKTSFDNMGPRRHGTRLLRLLGSPIGRYELFPRLTAAPEADASRASDAVTPAVSQRVFSDVAAEWNQRIFRAPPEDGGDIDGRPLRSMAKDLQDLFERTLVTHSG